MAGKIEDYGLIGNMHTAALVSRRGSIDWLCAPRFDSDACFASLVGYDEHGSWSIRPTVRVVDTRQRYRGDTLVLETEFVCERGVVRVTDALSIGTGPCDLLRVIEGVEGEVPVEMILNPRFGYGAETPWVTAEGDGLEFVAGANAMVLYAPVELERRGSQVSSIANIRKGDRLPFQLRWYPSHESPPQGLDVSGALASTEAFWLDWSNRCTLDKPERDIVMRSLLTLRR